MSIANVRDALVIADGNATQSMRAWMSDVSRLTSALQSSGTTANRPTAFLFAGRTYFDTTLGQPIWYDGSGWVDATGTAA